MYFLTGRQRSLEAIPKAAFIFRNSIAIILNRYFGASRVGSCCRTGSAPDRQKRMLVPFVGTNRKQASWNNLASDAVLKSMKDSTQPWDQAIVTGPAPDLGESAFSSIVAAGGGSYVGVLKEIPDKMESLVLFNSLRTRTTLAIPISHLTVEAVREHLAESDAAFAGVDAK